LPVPEFELADGDVFILRFEPNGGNGNAAQCLGTIDSITTAYYKILFTEAIGADGAAGEVELENREYILSLNHAPSYSTDTSTFTEIRRERVKCAS
jgi:hypothetical protein